MKKVIRGYVNYYQLGAPRVVKSYHFEVTKPKEVFEIETKFKNPELYIFIGIKTYLSTAKD